MIMQCAHIENKSEAYEIFYWHMQLMDYPVDRIQNTVTAYKYHSKSWVEWAIEATVDVCECEVAVNKIPCLHSFPRLERQMTVIFKRKSLPSLSIFVHFTIDWQERSTGLGNFMEWFIKDTKILFIQRKFHI